MTGRGEALLCLMMMRRLVQVTPMLPTVLGVEAAAHQAGLRHGQERWMAHQ